MIAATTESQNRKPDPDLFIGSGNESKTIEMVSEAQLNLGENEMVECASDPQPEGWGESDG